MKCARCKKEKSEQEMKSKKNCFSCFENRKEYQKQYRENHKDSAKVYQKNYKQEHKESSKDYHKQYHLKHRGPYKRIKKEKLIKPSRVFKKDDPTYSYKRERKKTDIVYKLRENISSVVRNAIKNNKGLKVGSCLKYFPYSIIELKKYLESLFEPWMAWNNYGKYDVKLWKDDDQTTWKWSIDHVIPQSKLPYLSMEDDNFNKCWALSNLRPYSAKQNNIDGNRRNING
jgi:hypothetical protein